MPNKDNKIDNAIDEVLESQRLKQGVGVIVKLLKWGTVLFVVGIIIAIMNNKGIV